MSSGFLQFRVPWSSWASALELHTPAEVLGVAAPLGVFMGEKAYFLRTLLLKMLTQSLRPSTSAFSGTSPYPGPCSPSWKWVLWLRSVLGSGEVRAVCWKKLLRQSQGRHWWGNPDRLLPLLVLPLRVLQSLTPPLLRDRRRENARGCGFGIGFPSSEQQ